MIYSVNFKDLTEKINPHAFVKYLNDTGWIQWKTKRNYIKVFQKIKEDGEGFQVTIPLDKELLDYKEAIYEAIETVAFVEEQSTEQLLLFLLNPNTDILKIRLDKRGVEAGNILFDDAINIYENAKKLIAATAQDIVHPKKYHQGRMDDDISKFINKCRFGQTEIGSYVVSIVCPFAELDETEGYKQLSIFSEEEECAESLTRKVTNRIMENISFIKTNIDAGSYDQLVRENESDKISVNFYEALNGLNLNEEGTNLEFMAQWSPAVKENRSSKDRITLSYDYYQPISNAIGKMRESVNTKTRIVGRINRLESMPDISKRKSGKISVVYLDEDDKRRTVSVNLNKEDYDRAIEAHERGRYIEIIGELKKQGKRKQDMNCEIFNVIE